MADGSSDVHDFQVLTLITNTKVIETRIVSSICTVISSHAQPARGLVVSVLDYETRGPESIPVGYLF